MRASATTLDTLRYEARALGPLAVGLPLFTVAVFAALAVVMRSAQVEQSRIDAMLLAGLETGLPLACGICAAGTVASEPAVELKLTLPVRYRFTVLQRLALATAWTMLVALAATVALRAAGLWNVDRPFGVAQLVWLAPLLWFNAAGATLALLLRGRAAAVGTLAAIWFAENVLHDAFATKALLKPWFLFASVHQPGPAAASWLPDRITLLVMAGAFAAVAWLLLHQDEALLGGGEG